MVAKTVTLIKRGDAYNIMADGSKLGTYNPTNNIATIKTLTVEDPTQAHEAMKQLITTVFDKAKANKLMLETY